MAIAIFGASGRTGKLVVEEAGRRGWPARALVRTAGKVAETPLLKVGVGDARDAAAVAALLEGAGGKAGRAGAVICVLGMSDISVPATDFSDSVKTLVAAMKTTGVRRIVAVGSAGVFDHPAGGYRNQQPDFPAYLKHISAEHVRNHETLMESGLDWTLMCPLTLAGDLPAGPFEFEYGGVPAGSEETGTADLARLVCDLLTERASFGQRVGIVSRRGAAA